MKIVITGARGFLGSCIVRHALAAGHEVVGVDLASTRAPSEFDNHASYSECLFDLLDPSVDARSAFEKATAVIHCAARIVGPPDQVIRTNVEGTEKLMALTADLEARFVLLSSMAVVETHPGPYGHSKQEAEARVKAKRDDYTFIRPAMIYGRGDPNWTRQLRRRVSEKKVLFLLHGGRSKIQPLHVDDAARAILDAALHDNASQKVLPIGGPQPVAQIEFLRLAREALNGQTRFIPLPLWPIKMLGKIAGGKFAALAAFHGEDHPVDIGLAKEMLEFDPLDARDGLARTFGT